MSTSIGYPSHEAEVEVVAAHHAGASLDRMQPVLPPHAVADLIATAAFVAVAPELVDYIVRIVGATRSVPGVLLGASPRGSIGLLRACRARALAVGRGFVVPGDVQALAQPVLAHRLILDADAEARAVTAAAVISQVIDQVPAPQPS
jgi:MoxR-like ATPase